MSKLNILRVLSHAGGGVQSDVDLLDRELLKKEDEIAKIHLFYQSTRQDYFPFHDPRRIHHSVKAIYAKNVFRRNLTPKHIVHLWKFLNFICDENPIDLIHSHSPASVVGQIVVALARKKKIPLLQTFHGSRDPRFSHRIRQRVFLALPKSAAGKKLAITRAAQKLWRPHDSEVIGVPVDREQFSLTSPQPLSESDRPFIFLCPARIIWVKNQICIPDLARALRDRFPSRKILFRLLGSVVQPSYYKEILKRIQKLDVSEMIRFEKLRAFEAMAQAYDDCDALIFPTLEDGLGKVIIEAGLRGKPTLAYATGGVPEVIRSGTNGLLVKTGDLRGLIEAAAQMIQNDRLRFHLGIQAKISFEQQFKPETFALRHLEIYREIANTEFEMAMKEAIAQLP